MLPARHCILLVLAPLLGLGNAWAAGVFNITCDGVAQPAVPFVGLDSGPVLCALGSGSATFRAVATNAGLDWFQNMISVDWDTRSEPQDAPHTVVYHVVSNPTWSPPPPPMVTTVLALTGIVNVTDTKSSLTLDLVGILGGPISELTGTFNSVNCSQCVLNTWLYKDQNRDDTADEWLTISSVGRTRYVTDSPTFQGAIPEPRSLSMTVLGVLAIVLLRRRASVRIP